MTEIKNEKLTFEEFVGRIDCDFLTDFVREKYKLFIKEDIKINNCEITDIFRRI